MTQKKEYISIRNRYQDKTSGELLAEGKLDVDQLYYPTSDDLKKMEERDKENEETDKLVNSEEFNQMIEESRNNQDSDQIDF
ncbi:hypothetical protein [Calothrix sp. CCY 0018]|uniref:hypothetical protein n=1 Tax=Calothrix sp. CCY 0018 TaxID=3103864 RepID=UPI0039C74047